MANTVLYIFQGSKMTFLQDIKYTLLRLKDNSLIRQTGIYSLMQVFSLGMAFLINIFLAKEMGPDLFGIYSFSVAVMTFVGLFFEFGLFSTAAKILADNRNAEEERHWVGAFFCIFFII